MSITVASTTSAAALRARAATPPARRAAEALTSTTRPTRPAQASTPRTYCRSRATRSIRVPPTSGSTWLSRVARARPTPYQRSAQRHRSNRRRSAARRDSVPPAISPAMVPSDRALRRLVRPSGCGTPRRSRTARATSPSRRARTRESLRRGSRQLRRRPRTRPAQRPPR